MHKRLSIFLDKNKLIYSLKLGSRQNYSTSYTLIHLTETINQLLDQALFSCGIFVDLQNVFKKQIMIFFQGNCNTIEQEELPVNGLKHTLKIGNN